MKRIATCCFTGHRPEKLNVPIEKVLEKLEKAIEERMLFRMDLRIILRACPEA